MIQNGKMDYCPPEALVVGVRFTRNILSAYAGSFKSETYNYDEESSGAGSFLSGD